MTAPHPDPEARMREIAREEAERWWCEMASKFSSAPSPAERPEPESGQGADRLPCGKCIVGVYSHACLEHGPNRQGQGRADPIDQPAEAKGAPEQIAEAEARGIAKGRAEATDEVIALRGLYKALSRARDYNTKPGVNFTPSIIRAIERVDLAVARADAKKGDGR